MTIIGDKFAQFSTAISNLVGTRASRNMDNLTTEGINNISALASGLPQTSISNVCTYVTGELINGMTPTTKINIPISTASISGTFKGLIPAGKNNTGIPQNANLDSGTVSSKNINYLSSYTLENNLDLVLFVSSSSDGGNVYARKYVVAYNSSGISYDSIWFDLNENKLKINVQIPGEETSNWICLGDPSLYNNGSLISGAIPPVLKIGRFTLNGSTMSNIVFDKSIQLLDAGSSLKVVNTEELKIPTGTVISYMGSTIPEGFLPMEGQDVSRATYSNLFAVIGTSQTDPSRPTPLPSDKFQIADMTKGKYLMGATVSGSSNGYPITNSESQFPTTDKAMVSYTYYGCNASSGTDTHTIKSTLAGNLTVEKYNNKTGDSTWFFNDVPTISNLHTPLADGGRRVKPTKVDLTLTFSGTTSHLSSVYLVAMPYTNAGKFDGTTDSWYRLKKVYLGSTASNYVVNLSTSYSYLWAFGLMASINYPENSKSYTFKATATINSVDWEVEGTRTRIVGGMCHAGLPNIRGQFSRKTYTSDSGQATGCFTQQASGGKATPSGTDKDYNGLVYLDASLSSAIYGVDDTVVPESIGTRYLIKY